jgi:hypothetical protein
VPAGIEKVLEDGLPLLRVLEPMILEIVVQDLDLLPPVRQLG